MKGQSKRIHSPWRYRRGLGSEVNSSHARQMERWSCGKQLGPTTAGCMLCASPACCSKGASGLTRPVPSQMGQRPTFQSTQMCLSFSGKNSKMWPQSKWFLRGVCSPDPGVGMASALEPGRLITAQGSGRCGSGQVLAGQLHLPLRVKGERVGGPEAGLD